MTPVLFHNHYRELLHRLVHGSLTGFGPPQMRMYNERTGTFISVLPEVFDAFTLDLSDGLLPLPGNRRVFPGTAAAEIAWFLSGDRSVGWLRKHTKIWDKFTEDNGETVDAAYGYRWRSHFGRDQIALAMEALRKNPSDRRVVVSAWDPAEDGLGAPSKQVPCPVLFTLSTHERRDGPSVKHSLNMAVFKRSTDVFVGLPYDVMGHALLLQALAFELGMDIGLMHFTLAHPHMYDTHEDMAKESLRQSVSVQQPRMPSWRTSDIEEGPDKYVEAARALLSDDAKHPYNPRPELVL